MHRVNLTISVSRGIFIIIIICISLIKYGIVLLLIEICFLYIQKIFHQKLILFFLQLFVIYLSIKVIIINTYMGGHVSITNQVLDTSTVSYFMITLVIMEVLSMLIW